MLESTAKLKYKLQRLKQALEQADYVIIGAGAGLSAAAGFTYSGPRFEHYFSDFIARYGLRDMHSGGFYPYATREEYWAYWSRYIYINRYLPAPQPVYARLHALVRDKDYFVLTTNVDHCFQRAGFAKSRLFYTQGDYGLLQCSSPCCRETYNNEELVRQMLAQQQNMCVPTELLPHCPHCGRPLVMNLRADSKFVQDEGWYKAFERYEDFLRRSRGQRVLYLELGVGFTTPEIIKFTFWQLTHANPNATYACINWGEALAPQKLAAQAICINEDINTVIEHWYKAKAINNAADGALSPAANVTHLSLDLEPTPVVII